MLPPYIQAFMGVALALSAQLLVTKQGFRVAQSFVGQRMPSQPPPHHDDFDDSGMDADSSMFEPPTPPPQQPSPPRTHSPSPPMPQPDEVRLQSDTYMVGMRCGERIPPESITETNAGANRISVFVRAKYKEETEEGLHAWRYSVEFTNKGAGSVRLLTRHWVIVDAEGKVEEIKGPGAKGAMPSIEPGTAWRYESGTRIATPLGSMHGWFTFEEARTGHLFAVRVGRFALTHDGSTADVPCKSPTEAEGGSLPATSVHTTDRVIVGAIAEIAHRDDDLRKYGFAVDLQVNNGRAEAVTILAVRWEIIDANGLRQVSHGTVGDNGLGAIKLAPNSALRLRTTLPLLHTPSAKISGVLLARFEQPGEADSEAAPDVGGYVELSYDGEEEEHELVIAPLGASVDGGPVKSFDPLGFLA